MSHYTRLRDLATNTDQNIDLDTGDRLTRRGDQTVAVYDKQITSTSSSNQLSIDGALSGTTGILDFSSIGSKRNLTSPISSYPDIYNGTGYDVKPDASYRFFSGNFDINSGGVGGAIVCLFATMNPVAEISSLSVYENSTTLIYTGEVLGGYNNAFEVYAYIYQGKLRIYVSSSYGTIYSYSHSGTFMVLES